MNRIVAVVVFLVLVVGVAVVAYGSDHPCEPSMCTYSYVLSVQLVAAAK